MKAHLQANAQMVVEQLRPLSRMDFGYTQASVEWLEGYIERLRVSGQFKDEKMKNQLAGVFGSFLGEAVIRNYGGDWVEHDGAWCVAFNSDNVVFPLSKTRANG
ncbi:MAG TPA: hypothetical protein VH255_04700 [Verrucomicrobiae bacterium]|jgi:hypothetical protein|nr:hypothetical protein [Verrucomicrobiae bacterium]